VKLARICLDETLARRSSAGPFPMTGGWIQKLTGVGEHRTLRIRRLMIRKRMIIEVGSYRQRYRTRYPSGWRVTLFRTARSKASVRRPSPSTSWWEHPLFGFGVDRYPPGLPRWLRKWKEKPG
jgi:hypothetical protein